MNLPSFNDRPFGCPPDTILDLPIPPSVNRTRRINWAAMPKVAEWKRSADNLMRASEQYKKSWKNIARYELIIILDEKRCKLDPDNVCKAACDYLRRIEIIQNDAPKNARQITIKFGEAPEGMRLIVKPLEDKPNATERNRTQPNAREQASTKNPKKVAA